MELKDTTAPALDEMDELMSDWSWRQGQFDPGYVYTEAERNWWLVYHLTGGPSFPAVRPWSFPAYIGPVAPPPRIGVTR